LGVFSGFSDIAAGENGFMVGIRYQTNLIQSAENLYYAKWNGIGIDQIIQDQEHSDDALYYV